ncbi:MAG TPA: hypothetical protein VHE61_19920 [Opitutaceae bacterium]|nr:hypothetical protein [Opitutaceae bacterium]
MPRSVRLIPVLALFCLAPAALRAQSSGATPDHSAAVSNTPAPSVVNTVRERVLRMTDFLDTILPGTLGKENVTLHFTPKFSDFRDREFVRYPLEVRYGATDHLELTGGITPFGPNPINSGRDHRWGPGELDFGARYDLHGPLFFYDKATVGIENRVPIGKPPIDLNDGYTHVRPWLATSRTLRSHPFTTFYTNFSYDRSVILTHRETAPPQYVTRRHTLEIVPGLLYKPGEFGYFGEYRFRHFEEPTNRHLGHEVQVGTIWDVPLWRTERWRLPGKWQVELGYRFTTEEGRGHSQGITARVNWRTTLREVLTQLPMKSSH